LLAKEPAESLQQEAGDLIAMIAASRLTAAGRPIANRNAQI